MQNVYHISANFHIHFAYKIKRTLPAKFCIQNAYIQKFVKIWNTFCIHFVCKSLSKCGKHFVCKYFAYILYTFCIQNVYKSLLKCDDDDDDDDDDEDDEELFLWYG